MAQHLYLFYIHFTWWYEIQGTLMKIKLSKNEVKMYEEIIFDDNLLFELNAIPQMVVNKDRVIVRVNKKFIKLFGYSSDEILGKQTVTLTPSLEKFKEYTQYFMQTKEGIIKSEELEYKKKDGTLFWVKLEGNPINKSDDELLILWSFIDITKEVYYRKELKLLASTDPMTKLYNRRYFSELATTVVQLAKRSGLVYSVIMVDIDKFKRINDTYGHAKGDEVIIALSKVLKCNGRESDIVSRWGGEEFVILLPQTKQNSAVKIAEKLRKNIEMLHILTDNDETISFTISLGVATVDLKICSDVEHVINNADKALYIAKEGGRNRVEIYQ